MRVLNVLLVGLILAASGVIADSYNIPTSSGTILAVPDLRPLKITTSCGGHPAKHSYKKTPEAMVFTIHHGEKGRCPTDGDKGYTRNRPWAERTEVQSQKFRQGERYLFKVEISMDPDYQTGHKTTVFQVHQWDSKRCKCGPYVMVMFDRRGFLNVDVLKGNHSHQPYETEITRDMFENRWIEIAVDIDTSPPKSDVAVYVDGKLVVETDVLVQPGGTVFAKTGIYRPGNKYGESPSDRVYSRNLLYRHLPPDTPLVELQSGS